MEALILMTRIPIPGQTKTRLMDIFTGEECAEIHRCFLLDLFSMFGYIKEDVDIFLSYTPDGSLNILEEILPDYIRTFPQRGDNLGKRMENAINKVLNMGYKKVILIGSDIPSIQPEDVMEGFEILDDNDLCLGTTFDGGYYLIGMKKLYKEIFDDSIKWGRKTVLEGTMQIANNLGLRVGLATKHMDIDTMEDIIRFKEKINSGYFTGKILPKHTVAYLEKHRGEIKYVER
ncbi:TIGR04282 family arsenosugar biosynthesis glycosyltransferase [Tepidimicrobium xylanilyticum]|uniref:Glycosyltransferase n=1 Tax=Tepidimicrobium xylanilyticum TaxID=1123352 RepID=A0A1H3E5E1_9FIRM|nr:TIGR04282 family arsenosugar biosynthesis glycosyltransferase [Tepidimicrobium xylanilyticum]GMG95810.1 hypothetical protein EN5CB1_06360 [Tepidimicrobium xylanilyticum]SDX73901.1 hypothetical protein SAMN05660923_02833 [Tepidimicrobium xylanilyticum]